MDFNFRLGILKSMLRIEDDTINISSMVLAKGKGKNKWRKTIATDSVGGGGQTNHDIML
jgi:hypothetical protein